jgi:hypothetical protein
MASDFLRENPRRTATACGVPRPLQNAALLLKDG